MITTLQDNYADLECHQLLLQNHISDLQNSLCHWQLWEAEYEGFKEEILATTSFTQEALRLIGDQYGGQLLNQKEIDDILGQVIPRSVPQIINLLDRRLDYVERNIRALKSQLDTAKNKLSTGSTDNCSDIDNEDEALLTEITEEVDEEGEIISSTISTPGSLNPQVLHTLQRAVNTDVPTYSNPDAQLTSPATKNVINTLPDEIVKKSVTFTGDTKSGPSTEKSATARRVEEIMRIARQQESFSFNQPVIPINESIEDSKLRREMLNYGMSEVGAVVAELHLENETDLSDENSNDSNEEEISDSDEDSFGRSTSRAVSDELRQKMVKLEQRLGLNVMANIGKKASDYDVVSEGIGRITINAYSGLKTREEKIDSNCKDNATTSFLVQRPSELEMKSTAFQDIQNCEIVEEIPHKFHKNGIRKQNISDIEPSRLPERVTSDSARTVPEGPPGRPLAATIIERFSPTKASVTEPGEMDQNLLHQEIATEYFKMRNKMIQRQGGFLKEIENERVEFTEEEGGPKKLSRFKAARLASS
ncbi:Bgt-2185 [Blumeria graminis f. sp. tritici]|uniref:DUF3835 domain-containing protein n=3 Tax=Blumeria graminis f. sp. tritici TaxID=62690 RepID=A0A656KMM6_BLUGR|nr:hypothetical protein BGT96224_2185 [Blumeria graminis f. sp. tritici 96224]VCU39889.1 Bgt-2185 [Blumeria graminis f. sp. tritici]